jgi:hypothetical protein
MSINVNIPQFIGSALCTAIAYRIADGTLQEYFAGPLNEMATCILALTMGIGLFFTSIKIIK